MSHIFNGDTVRVKATFRDWAPANSVGALIDPDGQAATIAVYDSEMNQLETGNAVRESVGSFYFDWTSPQDEGTFFFEFKGLFNTKPQIARHKFTVRFRPDSV